MLPPISTSPARWRLLAALNAMARLLGESDPPPVITTGGIRS
jgi:hypothetical protein